MAEKVNTTKHIIGFSCDITKISEGLGSLLFEKMRQFKKEVAYTDATSDKKYSYEWVLENSTRLAVAMRARGVKPNDIIIISSITNVNSILPIFATMFLGGISCNIDPRTPMANRVYFFELLRPRMTFVEHNAAEFVKEAAREAHVDTEIITLEEENYLEMLTPSPEEKSFTPYEVDIKSTAVIIYTSGSTSGIPKGVCLSHCGLTVQGIQKESTFKNVLLPLSAYWIGGLIQILTTPLFGKNLVLFTKFNPNTVWDIIAKYKVNCTSLPPTYLIEMFTSKGYEKVDVSELKLIIVGGNVISEEWLQRIRKRLPNTSIYYCYGQTEQGGIVFIFDFEKDKVLIQKKPMTVGKPKPGFLYKIVNPNTEETLGPNQPGELRIKSKHEALVGYYKSDCSHMQDKDGYIKTEDLLYYDEDHCFFFIDRIKSSLKYKGFQISPIQIENVIYTHPAVKICVVSSKPHEIDDDHLLGVVVLKEEYVGKVSEEEILHYVNGKVEDQMKLRAGMKFVEAIPQTSTHKIDRKKITEMIRKGEI